MTTRYHGSKISGSQQSFLTETAFWMLLNYGRKVLATVLIMHRKVIRVHIFAFFFILAGPDPEILLPWQSDVTTSPLYRIRLEGYGWHTPIQDLWEYPPPPGNTDQKCLIIFRISDSHSLSFDCKFPGLFICRWCRACWFKSDWWLAAYFALSFPGHWSPLLSFSLRWSLNPFYTFIMVFIWFRIIWVAVF